MKSSFLSKMCCCSQSKNEDQNRDVQHVVTVSGQGNENPAYIIENESQTTDKVDSISIGNGHDRLSKKFSSGSAKSIDSFKSVRSTFTVRGDEGDYYSVCSEESYKST